MKVLIFVAILLCVLGGFGDSIKNLGKKAISQTNKYVVKPVVKAEQFVQKGVTKAAVEVGKDVKQGAKAIAHETEALYDHLVNLKTNEELQQEEEKLKQKQKE